MNQPKSLFDLSYQQVKLNGPQRLLEDYYKLRPEHAQMLSEGLELTQEPIDEYYGMGPNREENYSASMIQFNYSQYSKHTKKMVSRCHDMLNHPELYTKEQIISCVRKLLNKFYIHTAHTMKIKQGQDLNHWLHGEIHHADFEYWKQANPLDRISYSVLYWGKIPLFGRDILDQYIETLYRMEEQKQGYVSNIEQIELEKQLICACIESYITFLRNVPKETVAVNAYVITEKETGVSSTTYNLLRKISKSIWKIDEHYLREDLTLDIEDFDTKTVIDKIRTFLMDKYYKKYSSNQDKGFNPFHESFLFKSTFIEKLDAIRAGTFSLSFFESAIPHFGERKTSIKEQYNVTYLLMNKRKIKHVDDKGPLTIQEFTMIKQLQLQFAKAFVEAYITFLKNMPKETLIANTEHILYSNPHFGDYDMEMVLENLH